MVVVIAACEIGFWVLLAAGLLARYRFRRRRVSVLLLVCVPLTDLVLLAAVVIDLRAGATATGAHGLAAAYLGFSVAFGHHTIQSLDQWVAHRFAGGTAPEKVPPGGTARLNHEWQQWRQAAVAWAVACTLLIGAIGLVDNAARTAALTDWLWELSAVLGIWLVAGPLWAHLRPTTS